MRFSSDAFYDHAGGSENKDLVRDTCLQWQFSGDVRLHGLWLLCRGNWQRILPERKPIHIVNVVAHDFWGRLSDAAFGRYRARGIHRSPRTPRWPNPDGRTHVG